MTIVLFVFDNTLSIGQLNLCIWQFICAFEDDQPLSLRSLFCVCMLTMSLDEFDNFVRFGIPYHAIGQHNHMTSLSIWSGNETASK